MHSLFRKLLYIGVSLIVVCLIIKWFIVSLAKLVISVLVFLLQVIILSGVLFYACWLIVHLSRVA